MFIDAHTHAYNENDRALIHDRTVHLDECLPDEHPNKWILRHEGSVDALLREEERAGVDRFVLLPVSGRSDRVPELNQWVADQAKRHPAIIPFASLIAGSPTLEEDLGRALALGMKGVKIHPFLQRLDILSPEAHRMWSMLEEARLPVVMDSMCMEGLATYKPHLKDFIEMGRPFETGPERIAAVAEAHSGLRIISAHLGSLFGWDRLEPLYGLRNVYFDLSFLSGILPDETVMETIRRKGTDRILFGSDAPWRIPAVERRWFERLPLGERDREAISGENVLALLDGGGA
jgi:predicted TIM-barrel fold metal-dependent hydrolase